MGRGAHIFISCAARARTALHWVVGSELVCIGAFSTDPEGLRDGFGAEAKREESGVRIDTDEPRRIGADC